MNAETLGTPVSIQTSAMDPAMDPANHELTTPETWEMGVSELSGISSDDVPTQTLR